MRKDTSTKQVIWCSAVVVVMRAKHNCVLVNRKQNNKIDKKVQKRKGEVHFGIRDAFKPTPNAAISLCVASIPCPRR